MFMFEDPVLWGTVVVITSVAITTVAATSAVWRFYKACRQERHEMRRKERQKKA